MTLLFGGLCFSLNIFSVLTLPPTTFVGVHRTPFHGFIIPWFLNIVVIFHLFYCKQHRDELFFFFGCAGSSLLRAGFLYLQRAGATLCCGAWASHCSGFSCCRAQALGAQASVVAAHRLCSCGTRALERVGLSSCSAWAQWLGSTGSRRMDFSSCGAWAQ